MINHLSMSSIPSAHRFNSLLNIIYSPLSKIRDSLNQLYAHTEDNNDPPFNTQLIRNLNAITIHTPSDIQSETQHDIKKHKIRHYCFLVHGWMGNDSEMLLVETALKEAVRQRVSSSSDINQNAVEFIIYKTICNNEKTNDGIAKGGNRLAQEIRNVLTSPIENTLFGENDSEISMEKTVSFVGNSLGGLYARHAISSLHSNGIVQPRNFNIFCTTATPHLGCSSHTYVSIPRTVERAISTAMQQTGKDLFRNHPQKNSTSQNLIREMGLDSKYLVPLSFFHKRIAYANAFMTDFQVPTSTAAFLCKDSIYPHKIVTGFTDNTKEKDFIVGIFETDKQEKNIESFENRNSSKIKEGSNLKKSIDYLPLSNSLDALGWKKIFVDVRHLIPFPKMSFPSLKKSSDQSSKRRFEKMIEEKLMKNGQVNNITISSKELVKLLCPFNKDSVPLIPLGHTVMIANAKNMFYRRLNKGGEIVVEHIAEEMVDEMLKWNPNVII